MKAPLKLPLKVCGNSNDRLWIEDADGVKVQNLSLVEYRAYLNWVVDRMNKTDVFVLGLYHEIESLKERCREAGLLLDEVIAWEDYNKLPAAKRILEWWHNAESEASDETM